MSKNWPKFVLGWIISFLVRLIPSRPPNFEPVLSIQMPFSKAYGYLPAFFFAFFNIALYDAVTMRVGVWTWITALIYGLLGIWGYMFFKKRESTAGNYLKFSIMATLAYDALTGLSIGPLFFNQTFTEALIGQIPFTIFHLLGNGALALLVSPLVYRLVTGQSPILLINYEQVKIWKQPSTPKSRQ
ncbi:hypothetical protein HYT00_02050 [Candidatus Giovannonibacteria bacterium]|nr:hypothetical protein [Candidatus Giovannonibacteria bacterium]